MPLGTPPEDIFQNGQWYGRGGYPLAVPSLGVSVVGFGDSMIHRWTGIFTPTSITRSNNVATVTLAGHGYGSGKVIDINNATDPTYNVRDAVITRVDANTFTYPCVGPAGSAVAIGGRVLIGTMQEQINDDGFWLWLMKPTRFGPTFRMVKNAGVSSNTSVDMIARIQTDVLNYQSDWVFFRPTIYNDIVNAGFTLAQIIAYNTQILNTLRATRRKILIISPPAFSTGNTVARHQIWLGAIKWMQEQARTLSDVYFADVYAKTVNPLAGTPGTPLSGMLSDGIHESPRGADAAAQAIWEAIGSIVPRYNQFTTSSGDNYDTDSANSNIMPGLANWTNVGGTLNAATGAGTSSGTIGDGYQNSDSLSGAGGTIVWSMPARADGFGYDAQAVFTPSAANDFARLRLKTNIASNRWTPGQKVRYAAEMSIASLAGSNIRSINNTLNFQGGSNPTSVSIIAGQTTNPANWPAGDFILQFVSNDIVIPTDAGLTGTDLQTLFVANASGTAATCKIGRASLNKVS